MIERLHDMNPIRMLIDVSIWSQKQEKTSKFYFIDKFETCVEKEVS